MKKFVCFLSPFVIILLCLLSFPAKGQWKYLGSPENGITYKTFAKSDTLLVASEAGIFFSTDATANWKQIPMPDSLLAFREVWLDNQSLYVAMIKVIQPYAQTYVIFRSEDWGLSWKNITQTLDVQNICRSVYIRHDSLIWFGRYETLISFNRGDSYVSVGTGLPRMKSAFIINDSLYVFTVDGLLTRSHDLSDSWDTVYTEPSGLYTSSINAIGTTLWKVDMTWLSDTSNISRSLNRGKSWETLSSLPMKTSTNTEVIGDQDHLFLVTDYNDSFYYSADSGNSWQSFGVPEAVYSTVYHDGLLLLNTAHGVFKSIDNGTTLSKSNKGLEASSVFQIRHAWSALWVDDSDDVFKRQDGDDQWVSLDSLKNLQISADGHFAAFHNGIPSISSDGGNTWTPVPGNAIPNGQRVESNGFRVSGNVFFLNTNTRCLYSRDFGITWEIFEENNSAVHGIRNAFYNEKHLVITGYDDLLASDDGSDWKNINYNLDDLNAGTFVSFYYLAPYYFVCGDGRYYRLHQDSIQWIELNAPVPGDIFEYSPFSRVCSYTSYGNILLTPFYQRGIFASWDYGITWENIKDNISDLQTITLAVIEPDLYLGVDGGVWKRSLSELGSTGVFEVKNDLVFFASPMPAKDFLYITINDPVISGKVHLTLYDSKGSLVKSQIADNPFNIRIDVHNIPSGIYFLKAQVENKTGIVRVMKS